MKMKLKTKEIEDSGVIGDDWNEIFRGMKYIVERNQISVNDTLSIYWSPDKTVITVIDE